MKKRAPAIWTRARPVLAAFLRQVGLYLDDLLLVAAGICFTTAAGQAFGESGAMAVAGTCCACYSFVIARSRRGGDGE